MDREIYEQYVGRYPLVQVLHQNGEDHQGGRDLSARRLPH